MLNVENKRIEFGQNAYWVNEMIRGIIILNKYSSLPSLIGSISLSLVFLSSFDFGKLVLLVFITDHRTSAFEEFCLHTDFISAIHLDAVYMGFHGYLTFHCIWNKIFSL